MRVTEYILNVLAEHGIRDVFGITGGAITPMFDAFHGRTDIRPICVQHEQAAAMAAEAYARFKGLGACIATSGPGATNLLTGLGCAWCDSIPVIAITGNVNTHESREGTHSWARQVGFQEMDIVSMAKSITKYAAHVTDIKEVRYEIEKAIHVALSERPGPVLIDLPFNIQRMNFEPDEEASYKIVAGGCRMGYLDERVSQTIQALEKAKRPVFIAGAGIRMAGAQREFMTLVERMGIPVLPSWAALDLMPHDHPLFVSTFGVYGSRAGNFAVQNADLIIAVGTRLDTRMTGGNIDLFAPDAVKIVCDIDHAELTKRLKVDLPVCLDAKVFLDALMYCALAHRPFEFDNWRNNIAAWKDYYPIEAPPSNELHPLTFVKALSDAAPEDALVVFDAGGNLTYCQQAWHVKRGQRVWSAYGFSPMGYSMCGAIGAAIATGKSVICVIGDGGMQVNIQELQTIKHYNLPIKVFIMNNNAYGIIQQFQDELFDGRYIGTVEDGGYSAPQFDWVARAYGLEELAFGYGEVTRHIPIVKYIAGIIDMPGPLIVDIAIDPSARIQPKTQFGQPLHNQAPFLSTEEITRVMEVSRDATQERVLEKVY